MLIKDSVAIVNCAETDFGLCIARECLKSGLKAVSLLHTDIKNGSRSLLILEKEFGKSKTIFINTDLVTEAEIEMAMKKTVDAFGSVDIVIYSPEMFRNKPQVTVGMNLNEATVGVRDLLAIDKYLSKWKNGEEGVIVNISYSTVFNDDCPSTNSNVISLCEYLSSISHYRATGIKILTLNPGYVGTSLCLNIARKVLPSARYQQVMQRLWGNLYQQKIELIAKAIVRILAEFETGDVWLVEENLCCQIENRSTSNSEKLKKFYL
ncbi:hypothetical protein Trydic_g16027 [Trypoxylus dichotomus]